MGTNIPRNKIFKAEGISRSRKSLSNKQSNNSNEINENISINNENENEEENNDMIIDNNDNIIPTSNTIENEDINHMNIETDFSLNTTLETISSNSSSSHLLNEEITPDIIDTISNEDETIMDEESLNNKSSNSTRKSSILLPDEPVHRATRKYDKNFIFWQVNLHFDPKSLKNYSLDSNLF